MEKVVIDKILKLVDSENPTKKADLTPVEEKAQQDFLSNTDLLDDLESHGLITQAPLKWLGTGALCAYFVHSYTEKYNIKHKSSDRRILKPFEVLFNVKDIRGKIRDYMKILDGPVGHETINEILNYNVIEVVVDKPSR